MIQVYTAKDGKTASKLHSTNNFSEYNLGLGQMLKMFKYSIQIRNIKKRMPSASDFIYVKVYYDWFEPIVLSTLE